MKVAVLALFTASALASVVPTYADSYPEAPGYPVESSSSSTSSAAAGYPTSKAVVTSSTSKAAGYPSEVPKSSSSSVKKFSTSTVYETKVETVTKCPPEVTNCPASSVVVVTNTIPVSTTICPVEEEESSTAPGSAIPTKSVKKPTTQETGYPVQSTTKSSPKPTYSAPAEEECSSVVKVKTISTSVTKVVPTVIYETVTEGCTEPTKGPSPPKNGTTTTSAYPVSPKPTKPVEAGASTMVGSAVLAAVAGLAAFAFA